MQEKEQTVEEWFHEVSDKKLREVLLRNTKRSTWDSLYKTCPSLADALKCAFPWNEFHSPPGYPSWMKMHKDMNRYPERYMSKLAKHKEKLNV